MQDEEYKRLDAMLTNAINRRHKVETELLDMARGKLPMPTPEKLRELAIYLGTPDETDPS